MPLPSLIENTITSASACSLWATPDVPERLDRAAHADNTASAVAELRLVQANLLILMHRVQTGIELCEGALRSDEEVPAPIRPGLRLVRAM